MRAFSYLSLFATICLIVARSPQHAGKRLSKPATRIQPRIKGGFVTKESEKVAPRQLTAKSKSFGPLPFGIGSPLTMS